MSILFGGAENTVAVAIGAAVIAVDRMQRRVEPGETVGPGQPLLTVYAPDDLRIEVRVPQSAADAIRAKPQAQVVFDDGRVSQGFSDNGFKKLFGVGK